MDSTLTWHKDTKHLGVGIRKSRKIKTKKKYKIMEKKGIGIWIFRA